MSDSSSIIGCSKKTRPSSNRDFIIKFEWHISDENRDDINDYIFNQQWWTVNGASETCHNQVKMQWLCVSILRESSPPRMLPATEEPMPAEVISDSKVLADESMSYDSKRTRRGCVGPCWCPRREDRPSSDLLLRKRTPTVNELHYWKRATMKRIHESVSIECWI